MESDTTGTADRTEGIDAAATGNDAADTGNDAADTGNDRPGLKLAAVVALAAGVLAGLWGLGFLDTPPKPEDKPVECAAPGPTDQPGYPSLCAALDRPDLPALLGTPEDRVTTAHPAPLAFGKDVMVEVRLKHTVVSLMDSNTSVQDMIGMPQFFAKPATVLGHPAVTYSSSATVLGPEMKSGPATRNLVVAQDPKAPGGRAFEFAVFRQDGLTPDEAALNRLAETVLPTLPGWVAAP
ncbi:DUF6215 domain-containing protein [Kitasatospora sp. NPDC059577]|uniref:DUF6215 domain-containing protein n=1 Tax=Kitasatospora sp. NPDC059577 TaxID=3346873 RepID=UPI0036BE209F